MSKSNFFEKVYEIVEQIPSGEVYTYGQIAMMLGNPRAARIVGYAMSSAPRERNLPCHRVVYQDGRLAPGGIFGGKENQRRLLEEEGITFLNNGRIDMDEHGW
ncbi:MAG: MGMT family protein [Firmicutes bacterium]|nr:MGMT family protein [Bacillota bacterium]